MKVDVIGIWHSQMKAGEDGDVEKAISYYDQDCEWRLVTSGKSYRGRLEISNFIKSGFKSAVIRDKPDIVTEFASDEWGVFEYVSRGRFGREAIKFSTEIEQPSKKIFAGIEIFFKKILFNFLLKGFTFEIPVCFIYHINNKGLIDQVHEYAAVHR